MIGNTLSIIPLIINQAIGFTSVDINTASFESGVIPEYKSPGTRQWGGNVANNTAYNFRHSDQNLFLFQEAIGGGVDKTFDTARNYINKHISAQLTASVGALPFSYELDEEWILLTTTFQAFAAVPAFAIRAENGGGITLRAVIHSFSVTGRITDLRLVTGS